jgi:cobalt/nickel transport system permease protein
MDAVAAPSVAWFARRAQRGFDHYRIPLMGVMGAFIFAVQMINFPVGGGTSSHLVGGALLAFTLGPAAATVVMTAILATQALIFQDGGLLALGANVFNMAIAGVWAGYLPYLLLRGRKVGIFLGGMLSLLVSAVFAMGELLLSHNTMPRSVLMLSVLLFVVSAVMEGAITVAVVEALERIQPDLLRRPRALKRSVGTALAGGGAALAGAGALLASTEPDGIQSLAQQTGVWQEVTASFHAPLAHYEAWFVAVPWLRRSLAGIAGLIAVYLVCVAVSRLILASRPALPPREGV